MRSRVESLSTEIVIESVSSIERVFVPEVHIVITRSEVRTQLHAFEGFKMRFIELPAVGHWAEFGKGDKRVVLFW